MKNAFVFNIMHYSIHDGPGIRTTVFFKGCPLRCKWCHNPESFEQNTQTLGYKISTIDLMQEIRKDVLFFEQSQGGVTFSGGEPFLQADFLLDILKRCKNDYIHTAIDTCGYCDTKVLLEASEITDCFLYDIKFIDSKKHEKYCGASNDLILENLKILSDTKTKLYIRIPVIPTINDNLAEMIAIFEFIKDFNNIEIVHLLPYHNIQSDKYKNLRIEYELSEIPGNESPNMPEIEKIFKGRFKTKIGG